MSFELWPEFMLARLHRSVEVKKEKPCRKGVFVSFSRIVCPSMEVQKAEAKEHEDENPLVNKGHKIRFRAFARCGQLCHR